MATFKTSGEILAGKRPRPSGTIRKRWRIRYVDVDALATFSAMSVKADTPNLFIESID